MHTTNIKEGAETTRVKRVLLASRTEFSALLLPEDSDKSRTKRS